MASMASGVQLRAPASVVLYKILERDGMKVLKVLGIIVGLLVVAVFVFWLGWLKPPAAQDVCDNVATLMEKEGAKLDDAGMKACVDRYSKQPEFGIMPWTKKLKCIRDAGSLADVDKCGK